ncbi:MAG: anthranilate synthase component I family protein [Phycisphaerae bacterium]|nr:anthranilate synthase component I family protein [Phycisphaerae bacterium]
MRPDWDIREAAWPADVPAAAWRYADGGELAWLDSPVDIASAPPGARFSLLCTRPCAVISQFDGGPATLVAGGVARDRGTSGWRLWRRACDRLPHLPELPWEVGPGWVGYIGFELGRQLERLPASHAEDLGLPLLRLGLYDRGIVLDHAEQRAFAVRAQGLTGLPWSADGDDEWLARWAVAATTRHEFAFQPAVLEYAPPRADFQHAVSRALAYIAAGDIYQVNLARRLRVGGIADAFATYVGVRRANPAPYAALLRWSDGAIASVSPELFLRVRGDVVLTQPIKGTRPHTGHPAVDERNRRELLESAKEAAELAMIVDLHRNDLGRVCRFGSVRVAAARRVEVHPTVFHTVADVTGRLAPGRDGLELLAACFPAGSISGVPKIRALEIIDELEPVARGAYTGALGVLGLDGQMTFNVAIRTLQIRGPAATLYVGGGIVADSQPAAEYAETCAKAAGILRGLGIAGAAVRVAV